MLRDILKCNSRLKYNLGKVLTADVVAQRSTPYDLGESQVLRGIKGAQHVRYFSGACLGSVAPIFVVLACLPDCSAQVLLLRIVCFIPPYPTHFQVSGLYIH